MNRLFRFVLIAVAVLAATACNSNDAITVDNPLSNFCEVDNNDTPISQLSFDSFGGFKMVDICSNVDWSLSDTPDWITISNHSGVANADGEALHLKITVSPNDSGEERSAKLILTGNQNTSSTLTISQTAEAYDPSGWQSAIDACNAMKVGLNLFNTLDANGTWFDQDDVTAFETCWGQPAADQEWFTAVRKAGFNAVRIPVTWFPHMDDNWQVKTKWMDRVEEVVNYALNEGLYVIINLHHDTGAHDDAWVVADWNNIDHVLEKFNSLWSQIATRFNKYDEHLLFESYNELLDENFQWNSPKTSDGYLATNALAQNFVNTVRATGGNNEHRNLVVNLYSAHGGQAEFDNFVVPTDMYPNHILVQVHNYSPMSFTGILDSSHPGTTWTKDHETELAAEIDILAKYSNSTHVPIVIGEAGAADENGDDELAKYGEFLVTYSRKSANICVFYWYGVIDRRTYKPTHQKLMEALLKGNDY